MVSCEVNSHYEKCFGFAVYQGSELGSGVAVMEHRQLIIFSFFCAALWGDVREAVSRVVCLFIFELVYRRGLL